MPTEARHPNHGALPGKAELERLYVQERLSFAQIAARYGVQKKTVYNTMKRRAERAGTPWPLKATQPGWRRRAAQKHSEVRWDGVTAMMVRAEIAHCRETLGVPLKRIIELSGVSQDTVWQISCGVRKRISRATAHKIMGAIEQLEVSYGAGRNVS